MRTVGQLTALQWVQGGLATMAATDPVAAPDEEVRADLPAMLRAYDQFAAIIARTLGTFDARSLSELDGFRSTRTWLTAFGRMSQGAASGWLSRARLLRELPGLAQACGRGDASPDHVGKVADLVRKIGAAAVHDFDSIIAELASTANPVELGKACERIRASVDPDGPAPDPHAAFERRALTISRCGSMFAVRGQLDEEGAAALMTALDALMRPPTGDDLRTAAQRRADAMIELSRYGLTSGQLPTIGGVRPQLGILITPKALLTNASADTCAGTDRTNGAVRGSNATGSHTETEASTAGGTGSAGDDAQEGRASMGSVCADHDQTDNCLGAKHEPAADNDGPARTFGTATSMADTGSATSMTGTGSASSGGADHEVTSGRADPLSRAGVPPLPEPPWMGWVGEIPVELAQRVACDCEVWRAVLDPATGLPLEVGRAHRIVPHWIRKALHARDRGCRWPKCEAPAGWTDAHHLLAWYVGGQTNIDNLLLLCRFHHAKVHEGRWQLTLDPSTGEVSVLRPGGKPYELSPSQPWVGPNTRRGDPETVGVSKDG